MLAPRSALHMDEREWLEELERRLEHGGADAAEIVLAFVAGRDVTRDEDELHGVLRRGLLLLAAAGDPLRAVTLDARAVAAVADELDAPERRAELAAGLRRLAAQAAGLPQVLSRLDALLGDPGLAWRAFACSLLGDALAE